MTSLDPTTGSPLPPDAIQRILYITPKVHIYAVPPLTSSKGYTAATWTTQPAIFTSRLRILETAIPTSTSTSTSTPAPARTPNLQARGPPPSRAPAPAASATSKTTTPGETVTTTILLEDPATGALFAAAPYTHPSVVAHCLDSSRFFAVRVVGDGGMKATLGIGFEERSDAFDFGVTLQDAGKVLGFEAAGGAAGGRGGGGRGGVAQEGAAAGVKKDYSLKEGETITVDIGGKGRRARMDAQDGGSGDAGLFSIKPPPVSAGAGVMSFLPPPPSAEEMRKEMRGQGVAASGSAVKEPTAEELGFDDGEFGEFQ